MFNFRARHSGADTGHYHLRRRATDGSFVTARHNKKCYSSRKDASKDIFKWYDLGVEVVGVDPETCPLVTGEIEPPWILIEPFSMIITDTQLFIANAVVGFIIGAPIAIISLVAFFVMLYLDIIF